ncbi:hypothetical protein [Streptomyces sp. TRM70350]
MRRHPARAPGNVVHTFVSSAALFAPQSLDQVARTAPIAAPPHSP